MAVYKKIREDIINNILSGVYSPHDMIETQEYFSQKFGVSRATIRKALDELVERQILYTVQGKGTFVADVRANKVRAMRKVSFSESERRTGNVFSSRVIEIIDIPADIKLAKQLGIELGEKVVCIKRIRLVNNFPENYQISYITKALVNNVNFEEEQLETGSLFKELREKAQLIPYYTDEEVRAISCPIDIADLLSIPSDEPLLFIRRLTYTKENVVMEYCEDYECSSVKGLKVRTYAEWNS